MAAADSAAAVLLWSGAAAAEPFGTVPVGAVVLLVAGAAGAALSRVVAGLPARPELEHGVSE